MADKPLYARGELDAVKKRLGPISDDEARKMQAILGGEVGKERSSVDEQPRPAKRQDAGGRKPARIVEALDTSPQREGDHAGGHGRKVALERPAFSDRIKMDVLCGDHEFSIKTWLQVLISRFSFLRPPPDRVSAYFVRRVLVDYCNNLDYLVNETRMLFPRNKQALSEKVKSISSFSFTVLDTIRRWNIEAIHSEKNKLLRHAGNAYVSDFSLLLYHVYRPIYMLECLEVNPHIETVYNTLYRILFLENASTETEKKKHLIGKVISSFMFVCKDVRRRLYPLFLKTVSSKFYYYDDFFIECEENIESFLGVSKVDRIMPPADIIAGDIFSQENPEVSEEIADAGEVNALLDAEAGSAPGFSETEQKAFDKGLDILNSLFPRAGFLSIYEFPDFYPYFADVKSLPKGAELIAPEDPCALVLILSSIIEELLYGFRKIRFTAIGGDAGRGSGDEANVSFDSLLDNWQKITNESFERQYIPRIQECTQLFQHATSQKKGSPYALKLRSAIHWTRKYFFFPYYVYKDNTPPPFKKSDITALYPFVRQIRKSLSLLATEIGKAQKTGGREKLAMVEGIENPWDSYLFQIENPLSKRLNALLAKNQRDNVSLIFFTLAIVTVLDDIMNDERSFVYANDVPKLFRTGEDGETPVLWVAKAQDTFQMFKESSMARQQK
ncbi:MAG: hypothetical protein LBC72_04215 [Spirochaetaceae bacterium]|jgi:hypothetical protein|nr:hypothetical protein [Spirochaetaceae bacterium]